MDTGVRIIIPFHKLDFIPPVKIGVQENRIMGVKNQLRMVNINFIIMKDINDIHKSHGMDRSIKFINN